MTAQKPKAKVRLSWKIPSRNSPYPSNWLIPNKKAIEKKTTGLKAMPPKRGTTPWCIFRSSGISNSCFLKATNRIWGINTPAQKALITKTRMELTVQNAVIPAKAFKSVVIICYQTNWIYSGRTSTPAARQSLISMSNHLDLLPFFVIKAPS